ncbi:AAA family ATPase [Polyangium spumosum]|uniref:AAA family ATPase n=1 Tax=Polyangium spumosum TaxID=889282 RepID=A0A6N7PW97_9BACT|nr:AAA family ATPase [Polyangium spumosum]MRG96502.1 AAA family ATPase [Polyangium spumosum]
MLRSLKLVGVGPAPEIEMEFGSRINVMTGDNGLGKSFVLDVIWWALSGTWAGLPAWPRADAEEARIEFNSNGFAAAQFDHQRQQWSDFVVSPDALVMYARVDGSVAMWDPARSMLLGSMSEVVFHFSANEIIHGSRQNGRDIIRGLIADWVTWQERKPETPSGQAFAHLCRILEILSPNPAGGELIRPARAVRLFVDDAREFPTIDVGYGNVPIIHASAGLRRIISLAYLTVWAWHEHIEASRLLKQEPVRNIVFLMDEVENHLHPEWQRRILPALLEVLEGLGEGMQVQAHITTHAPMVLASLEPHWNDETDELFVFDLKDGRVVLDAEELVTRGDASRWLTSHVFKLPMARSIEAERAIEDAKAVMRGEEPQFHKTPEDIDQALHHTLPGQDPFWPRWLVFMEKPGA